MKTLAACLCTAAAAALGFVAAIGADAPQPQPRTYEVYRAAHTPTMDGKIDEPAWHRVVMTQHFTDILHPEIPEPFATQVKAIYDDSNLYVSLRAQDDDIWATMTQRDQPLWEEEVMEVYLDPDGDGLNYAEFEINPLGTVIDLLIPKPGDQEDSRKCAQWNCEGLKTGVRVFGTVDNRTDTDLGWTAELAIPWASVPGVKRLPPQPGDVFRVQFYRIERRKGAEDEPICLAWSPTNTFHAPAHFGRIVLQ